jgi:antirestriction protein
MLNVFITNLGKYNEGELVGEWVELPASEEKLDAVYERIGINEEYEEMFITDFESDIDGVTVDEYANIDELNELAEELETVDAEIVGAIIEATGYDIRTAIDMSDDVVYYGNMTMLDVAYEVVAECYELPEIAERYFDYEAFARDLSFDGYTETSNGVIAIW